MNLYAPRAKFRRAADKLQHRATKDRANEEALTAAVLWVWSRSQPQCKSLDLQAGANWFAFQGKYSEGSLALVKLFYWGQSPTRHSAFSRAAQSDPWTTHRLGRFLRKNLGLLAEMDGA